MTMRAMSCWLITIPLVAVSSGVWSATLIKFKDDSAGVSSEVWVSGSKARISMPEGGGYMIMDLKEHRQYMVSVAEKRVVDMTDMSEQMKNMPGRGASENPLPLDLKVEKKGGGPKIAGFATERYIVSVAGKVCFEEFLSESALRAGDVKKFTDAMSVMSDNVSGGSDGTPCDRAEAEMAQRYGKLGVPLRSVDAQGNVIHEVIELNTAFEAPAGAFGFPPGFQRTTLEEMMREMMPQMPPE